MGLQLGDNAKDGIRFLLLGGGALVLLRLLYAGLQLWIAPPLTADLPVAIRAFQNGYLIGDPMTLVVGGRDLPQRLALAVLLTMLTTVLVVLLGIGVARITRSSMLRGAVGSARWTLFVSGAWWFYAALALPPRTVQLTPSELVRTDRAALLNDLSLPWPGAVTRVPNAAVGSVEYRSEITTGTDVGSIELVEAISGSKRMVLAFMVTAAANSDTKGTGTHEELVRLAELLNSMITQK